MTDEHEMDMLVLGTAVSRLLDKPCGWCGESSHVIRGGQERCYPKAAITREEIEASRAKPLDLRFVSEGEFKAIEDNLGAKKSFEPADFDTDDKRRTKR